MCNTHRIFVQILTVDRKAKYSCHKQQQQQQAKEIYYKGKQSGSNLSIDIFALCILLYQFKENIYVGITSLKITNRFIFDNKKKNCFPSFCVL